MLAFGGSRTYHRIACAIEDAGFEIRDTIMWLYGSGFPKSMNIANSIEGKIKLGSANKKDYKKLDGIKGISSLGYNKTNAEDGCRPNNYNGKETIVKVSLTTEIAKKWQGWGTCLKPSFEPIIVARKPLDGTCIDNVIKWGVGGINVGECRIGNEYIKSGTMPDLRDVGKKSKETIGIDKLSFGQVENAKRIEYEGHQGRFPANTILTYDENNFEEVCGGFPNTKGGKRHNTALRKSEKNSGYGFEVNTRNEFNDSGSASRYFYCAKASKKDRDEGLDNFEDKKFFSNLNTKNGSGERLDGGATPIRKNIHPTVKPTELMQYLIRLVTPKDGIILDPFMGSGSTGKAVAYENKERQANYTFIGIEKEEEYCNIAKSRIDYVKNNK